MTGELPKEPTPDILESMTNAAKNLGIDTGDGQSAQTPPTATPPAEGGDAGADGGDPDKLLAGQDGTEGGTDGESSKKGAEGQTGEQPEGKEGSEGAGKAKEKEEEKDPELPDTTGTEKPKEKAPEAKKPETASERDKDLEFPENNHQSPKTKQIIEKLKTSAKQARDERDALNSKLQNEIVELKKAVEQGNGMTPAMKKQYDQYKEVVRQLQIERDPEIVEKYDNRIASNQKRVCDILQQYGLGTKADGTKIEGYIEKYIAQGKVSLKELAPTIKKLEEAGEVEAAEEIRAALLENNKLGRDRVVEIEDYKKNFDARVSQSEATQQRVTAELSERFKGEVQKDIRDIGTAFPELKRPPEPTAEDDEGTKAAKLKAIETWQTELGGIVKKIEKLSVDGVDGENTRFRTAIQGLIIRDAQVPRMRNQIKSLTAQLTAANSTLSKFRKSGTLPATSTANVGETKPAKAPSSGADALNGVDAIMEAAKGLGIQVD